MPVVGVAKMHLNKMKISNEMRKQKKQMER